MDARQKLVTLLRSIGLNQYEAQAYASLLLFGDATAGELSSKAEIPRPRVYDILGRLEKKGFIVIEPGRPVKYKAVPPKQAIDAYLKLKHEEFQKEVERLKTLADQLEREHVQKSVRAPKTGVWVLNTENMLRTGIQSAVAEARESAIISLTPEFIEEYGNSIFPAIEEAANKGVNVRVVIPSSLKGTFAVSGDVEVVESTSNLPPAMIVDNKKAIVAIPGEKKAILVENPEFAKSLRGLMAPHLDFV